MNYIIYIVNLYARAGVRCRPVSEMAHNLANLHNKNVKTKFLTICCEIPQYREFTVLEP